MKVLHVLVSSEIKEQVGILQRDLQAGDVLVVSPDKELSAQFKAILDKQLVEKTDARQELDALSVKLKAMCGSEAFHKDVDRILERVYAVLCQGMSLSYQNDSLQTYLNAYLVQVCSLCVASLLGQGKVVDSRDLIICESNNGISVVDWKLTEQNIQGLKKDEVVVVGGAYGRRLTGEISELGKHSSELTANIIASVLKADAVRFYVAGAGAEQTHLSYEEAAQCFSGGFPVYPPAMIPARNAGVPIEVAELDQDGKVVVTIAEVHDSEVTKGISGVFVSEPMSLVTIYGTGLLGSVGISSIIFDLLAKNGINIHFISQSLSEYSISFAVKRVKAELAEGLLKVLVADKKQSQISDLSFTIRPVAIVSVYGQGIKNLPGISGKVYTALGNEGINVIAASQGGEELSISIVIAEENVDKAKVALNALKG